MFNQCPGHPLAFLIKKKKTPDEINIGLHFKFYINTTSEAVKALESIKAGSRSLIDLSCKYNSIGSSVKI